MDLEVIPVAVTVGTSCSVAHEVVVGVGDPEACWSLICVEEAHGPLDHHDEIVRDEVLPLYAVLHENSMAHDVVADVVIDGQVLDRVQGGHAVIAPVH